jgi:carboxypeptidase D
MLDQNDTEYFNLSGALMYDPVIGQYEYVGQTIPTVPFVQKNAQFFNFNASFMAYLEDAYEQCGYKNYTNTYMAFPPAGVQPPLDGMSANLSTINCDVWTTVYETASVPNPCFNVYEISSMVSGFNHRKCLKRCVVII